jgi:hypothetical protein
MGGRQGEAGMVKRREDGQIGIFSLCLPVDVSSVAGRCQHCWSHAKAQRRKVRTEASLFQQFSFAPLREVKAGIDEPFENGLIGIISFCLPLSLTPFHHPRVEFCLFMGLQKPLCPWPLRPQRAASGYVGVG